MQHSTHVPQCPLCGEKVYRTHTCHVSGLSQQALPERGEQLPAARPLQLVPMPAGFRDQVHDEVASWPSRAQLHLVEEPDLDWHAYDEALTEDNGL